MTRRSGFTLAEVLITLGIIGVVAAMTIPNLIANTNGAKFRSGFKKAISTLNQAGLMAQAQYDYDYAGTVKVASATTNTDCATQHPESEMTFCAILNGTLTGQTYRGTVSSIKRQKQSSAGASATSYTITVATIPATYTGWHAYSLADGSILAFDTNAAACTLNIGANLSSAIATGGSLASCLGFIDVNGVTLPNKEVTCTGASTTTNVKDTACYVKNNATNMTDVFPVVFHDATVEPASNAAKYVLTTSK